MRNDPGPYYSPPGDYSPPPRHRVHWLPILLGVILAGVATVILLALLYPASFGLQTGSSPYHFGPFGGVFVLFFVLIVVFFIVRVAFWSARTSAYGRRYDRNLSSGGYGTNRPLMIARMRYARGEISREQYEQIMRDLGRRPGPP